jgi:hypothetical protein
MTVSDVASLIAATTALLTSIGGLVVAVAALARQAALAQAVNGHAKELAELASKAGFAAGMLAEREASTVAEPLPRRTSPQGPSPSE